MEMELEVATASEVKIEKPVQQTGIPELQQTGHGVFFFLVPLFVFFLFSLLLLFYFFPFSLFTFFVHWVIFHELGMERTSLLTNFIHRSEHDWWKIERIADASARRRQIVCIGGGWRR